jgi:phosphoserine phosphatase
LKIHPLVELHPIKCIAGIHVPIANGKNKYLQAIQYCEENNFTFTDAYFYSDSISDLPLLQVVGHPVCVCPDSSLRQIANKSGWTICDW